MMPWSLDKTLEDLFGYVPLSKIGTDKFVTITMKSMRRMLLLGLPILVLAATAMPSAMAGFGLFGSDVLDVKIVVVDDAGQPVPYATVGSVWSPYGDRTDPVHALEPGDLDRILMRNPAAWEYWNRYTSPLPYLRFVGLTGPDGVIRNRIDYAESAANRRPRPEVLTVAYGVYRQGYEPAEQVITVKREVSTAKIRVVLKRAPDYVATVPAYRLTLDQVRAEISDWRANERVSRSNHDRLERLRARLEAAAQEAIAAGDRRTAAHIMYWVAFMPEITMYNGKPTGYAQTNRKSERFFLAMKRAAEFDPDNVQLQASWLVALKKIGMERAWHDKDPNGPKQFMAAWLQQAQALDQKAGNLLWPEFHDEIIRSLGFLKQYEAQYKKIKWMISFEPKYMDYSSYLRVLEQHELKGR